MSSAENLTLVLVGPMGAGKTSVGRRIARILESRFVDTDRMVAAEHGPIPQIFAEHGEARFRELERAAVTAALAQGGIISLGGGAITDPLTRGLLRDVPVALLTVSAEAVQARISGSSRPLLADEDPVAAWTRIYQERRPWYDEVASATFDTSRRPMQRIAEEVAAWRREQA